MWGTYILETYSQSEAETVRDALEEIVGPYSGATWSTAGVYLFWNPTDRMPLYVGIASDLPVRFSQHHGLRGCPEPACKRKEISAYFKDGHERLGFTFLPLSSLSQPNTGRFPLEGGTDRRKLMELNEAVTSDALDEIRGLEGRLIAYSKARFGWFPDWNVDPGRVPERAPDISDGSMATAVGAVDILLQARKSLRDLAANNGWAIFEEYLHGPRINAVRRGVLGGDGIRNDTIQEEIDRMPAGEYTRAEILRTGYLEDRNPLTVGPVANPRAR